MTIVVDASVAVKWVIPEVLSDQAGSLLALIDGLATSALVEPGRMPPDRARRLLDLALGRIEGLPA